MRIGDISHRGIVTAQASDRLADAARKMRDEGVGSLAVYDGNRLAGILTERDLVRALADGLSNRVTLVEAYMSDSPVGVGADEDSSDVARRMLDLGVRHLPVLDGDQLIGMVSARDLLVLEAWPPRTVPAD